MGVLDSEYTGSSNTNLSGYHDNTQTGYYTNDYISTPGYNSNPGNSNSAGNSGNNNTEDGSTNYYNQNNANGGNNTLLNGKTVIVAMYVDPQIAGGSIVIGADLAAYIKKTNPQFYSGHITLHKVAEAEARLIGYVDYNQNGKLDQFDVERYGNNGDYDGAVTTNEQYARAITRDGVITFEELGFANPEFDEITTNEKGITEAGYTIHSGTIYNGGSYQAKTSGNYNATNKNDFIAINTTKKITLNGGNGDDMVDFSNYNKSLNIDLSKGKDTNGSKYVSIENIFGTGKNDTLTGDGKNNTISGNGGKDKIYGKSGNDTLAGGSGNDTIYGGSGNDFITGGSDNDKLYGDAGKDSIGGGKGNDLINGGGGNDIITGGSGKDVIHGSSGNDKLYGGSGNDQVYGGSGKDILYGGKDNDYLFGGDQNDELHGNSGNDTLSGGKGNDKLKGYAGKDVFKFSGKNEGIDHILDFENGIDKLLFEGASYNQLKISKAGADVKIVWGQTQVILDDINMSAISASDFI